jgi:hypothetical protein
MGLDFYEIMKRAPEIVERWKKYYPLAQRVWINSRSHEELTAFLLAGPEPNPEELERLLAFIKILPHFLRDSRQGIAKGLPLSSTGANPPEMHRNLRAHWPTLWAGRRSSGRTEAYGTALWRESSNHTKTLATKSQMEAGFIMKKSRFKNMVGDLLHTGTE